MIRGRPKLPDGSIAWASGEIYQGEGENRELKPVWNYIPPPWNMDKPITLFAPPVGAIKTDSVDPHVTVQMIGKSGAPVPSHISVDKGVVDILISEGGKRITFFGNGEYTDYGTRDPSTTKGMSIPESGNGDIIDTGDFPGAPVSMQGIQGGHTKVSRKTPKRKVRRRDDFSDTSLRGIRW